MRKFNILIAIAAFSLVISEGMALIFSELRQLGPSNEMAATVTAEPLPVNPVYEYRFTDDEIELIALVTMAEAEGECEEGKRLVIDTILNRVESEHFPDTVNEVIYQPYQFSSMWNGRVDRCCVREDICRLVKEELQQQTNREVVFFNAEHYSEYGVPLLQVENHYFSSYA